MNREKVYLNGLLVGEVYLSSHGVWVAQPAWDKYSCSFATKELARLELMLHAANQSNYNNHKGMSVQ